MGSLNDFWGDDMTFCMAKDCANMKDCYRNPKNIRIKDMPHSFADFSNSCKDYKKEEENDNSLK